MNNLFHLPENTSSQTRSAWRIALIGLSASIVAASFYLYLALTIGAWQLYVWSADIWLLTVAIVITMVFIRRDRISWGVWILLAAIQVTFIGAVALIQGTGLLLGVSIALLVSIIAGQTFSGRVATLAHISGALSGAVAILLDLYLPPYRFSEPELIRIFLPTILGIVILLFGYVTVQEFRNYSLHTKLLLSITGITGLVLLIYGGFFLYRAQQTQAFWSNELQSTVQQQARQQAIDTTQLEAHVADQALSKVTYAVEQLANYRSALYAKPSLLGQGGYWDASANLQILSGGQYGNASSDTASVFIPDTVTLNPDLIIDLNTSRYLDFSVPEVLKADPNIVAVYYIGASNFTVYYPNIGLASTVPPDFNATEQSFYTIATPTNDPDHKAMWTEPYQDPAGTGLIVTNAVPVYDQNNQFRGVLAADTQLEKISQEISGLKLGKSGFAFLIDPSGHIIAMPNAGYALLGIQPEVVPVNETPKTTLLSAGPADLQMIIHHMVAGESDMITATIQGNQYDVAYAPLPTIGYSIGLIAPRAELDATYLAAQNQIASETQFSTSLSIVIGLVLLLATAGISIIISQFFSTPLVKLTKVATEVTAGNLEAKAEVQATDEIGFLAQTFNTMTSHLRETLEGLEQRVAARTKDLATVASISTTTATIRDPFQMLATAVHLTQRGFGLYHAHVFTYQKEKENLEIMACGWKEGDIHEGTHGTTSIPIAQDQSLVARAARTRKPVIINNVRSDPSWLPNPLLPDTRAELAVPMIVGDELLGVLDVQADHVDAFSDQDANIQMTLASQIATALQSAQTYVEAKTKADLEETVNIIGQKIQRTASVEDALQTAIREVGLALGAPRVSASITRHPSGDNGIHQN